MKKTIVFLLTLLTLSSMSLQITIAQDYIHWGLPEGATARLGKGNIGEIAYSSDGKLLAVGTTIGIWIYDAESGEELSLLTGHRGYVNCVAFSPDGTTLASGGHRPEVWLWDVATGTLQTKLATGLFYGYGEPIKSVAFSPDGTTVAAAPVGRTGARVRFWDVATGAVQAIKIVGGRNEPKISDITFSPDGTTLAVLRGSSVYLLDIDTLQITRRHQGPNPRLGLRGVAFNPNGTTLAAWTSASATPKSIWFWDVVTGAEQPTSHIKLKGLSVTYIAFDPYGTTLAVTSNQRGDFFDGDKAKYEDQDISIVQVFDVSTGREKTLLKHIEGKRFLGTVGVAFSSDGTLLAAGTGTWDKGDNSLEVNTSLFSLTGHLYHSGLPVFSPDGTTIAIANPQDRVDLWDVATGNRRTIITPHHIGGISSLAFSSDGTTLATSGYDTKHRRTESTAVWDVATGALNATLPEPILAFRPYSTTIFLTRQGLCDVIKKRCVTLSPPSATPDESIRAIALSPDGTTVATVSRNFPVTGPQTNWYRLWNVDTALQLAILMWRSHKGYDYYLVGPPQATLGQTTKNITIVSHPSFISFSPDSKTLVTVDAKRPIRPDGIQLWDVATSTEQATLTGTSAVFSPDSKTLAISTEHSFELWDVATSTLKASFSEIGIPGSRISGEVINFSPDGTTLATRLYGRTHDIQLWDVATGSLQATYSHTGQPGIRGQFSPDGTTFATSGGDGTIILWGLMPTSATEPNKSPEDVNGDSEVNIQDLVTVAAALGETGENDADVNGDGEVNIQDLVAVAAALGEVAAAPSALRQQATGHLTAADVQHWITQAQHAKLTDPHSQAGIRFLQYLLAALMPKETALLANYPNPFNPETWIPYQLAKPADVQLTIYDINGRVVRDLDLGHQRAGMYHSRSRAAYWDGRNAVGEPVASGVYFYTLTAGEFSATRKLLIRK